MKVRNITPKYAQPGGPGTFSAYVIHPKSGIEGRPTVFEIYDALHRLLRTYDEACIEDRELKDENLTSWGFIVPHQLDSTFEMWISTSHNNKKEDE